MAIDRKTKAVMQIWQLNHKMRVSINYNSIEKYYVMTTGNMQSYYLGMRFVFHLMRRRPRCCSSWL